jgi:5-methylcytosine-specific restriction endonuclease McrA
LRPEDGKLVGLEEVAGPFSTRICEHLKLADKQGTFSDSRFLDACRNANSGKITHDQLIEATVRFGFNNVIDAFHVVGNDEIPKRFFLDERRGSAGGIKITDHFSGLVHSDQSPNLLKETEARWRLVETAWELGISRATIVVRHDPETEGLFAIDRLQRRRTITGSRGALNGYQRGKCFYCFATIMLDSSVPPDVDHFFPHTLKTAGFGLELDGVWNLVLACRECNRGRSGKFDRVPTIPLLERLNKRNEYLISSHHPLRETLMAQTGLTEQNRQSFLNGFHNRAVAARLHVWEPVAAADATF